MLNQPPAVVWNPTTADKYDEMLNVLPPAAWIGGAFLVGEPVDHCPTTGAPRYEAYWQFGDAFVVSSRAITTREFRASVAHVPEELAHLRAMQA